METTLFYAPITDSENSKSPVHSFVTVSIKKRQLSHIDSPKMSFLKKLIISHLSVPLVTNNATENIYMITTPLYKSALLLVENFKTNKLYLYQDDFLLSDNQSYCSILLNKIKEKPGF